MSGFKNLGVEHHDCNLSVFCIQVKMIELMLLLMVTPEIIEHNIRSSLQYLTESSNTVVKWLGVKNLGLASNMDEP